MVVLTDGDTDVTEAEHIAQARNVSVEQAQLWLINARISVARDERVAKAQRRSAARHRKAWYA